MIEIVLHRSRSQDIASSDVRQEEQGDISLGWQGKSAAFGPAHVVDGVEVLRGDESGHAVAARRNLRQINASRAVGLRTLAVRYCRDDRHHFRFIISPEDAAELGDLRTFTRELMTDVARDLGTKLDWIAVDLGTPTTHIFMS
jgi:hypothetical protein